MRPDLLLPRSAIARVEVIQLNIEVGSDLCEGAFEAGSRALHQEVTLHLRHRRERGEHHLARGGGQVEIAELQHARGAADRFQALDSGEHVSGIAAKPVEPGDDQATRAAQAGEHRQHGGEFRPLGGGHLARDHLREGRVGPVAGGFDLLELVLGGLLGRGEPGIGDSEGTVGMAGPSVLNRCPE